MDNGVFLELPYHDLFSKLSEYLSVKDILMTRQVCKLWNIEGKKKIIIYRIGLNNDGWYKWDIDEKSNHGWGMILSVDQVGNIKGRNKNNSYESVVDKKYSGTLKGGVFHINVKFKVTKQRNEYIGQIDNDGVFRGKFKLIKSNGSRKEGDTGIIEGLVKSG